MPWFESWTGSVPTNWTWSARNLYNQHVAAISVNETPCAITGVEVNASGRGSSVSTRCFISTANGAILGQSGNFTMSAAGDGSQSWQGLRNITPYRIASNRTIWAGLYRNPTGSHTFRTGTGTGYRKTNTNSFPSIITMSSAVSHNKRPVVRVFYITPPLVQTNLTVTRVSDTSQRLNWTRTSPTNSDYPYTNQKVERQDNINTTWREIKNNLTATATSFTDTTTIANRRYRYRVRAWNAAGNSVDTNGNIVYVTSGYIKTTPAAPSNVIASVKNQNVNVRWTNNATSADSIRVERWNGSNWVLMTNTLSGTATSWTDGDPVIGESKYQVRTQTTTPPRNSSFVQSNIVVTLSKPNVPTNLQPNFVFFTAAQARLFTWRHNTTDFTEQTKYSLRYRIKGAAWGATQLDEIPSNVSRYTFNAGTFTNGNTYEWQVRTWGEFETGSDWSNIAEFYATSLPTTTITSPSSIDDYITSKLKLEWTYNQAESSPQTQFIARLYDNLDELLEEKNISSSAEEVEFDFVLSNNQTYKVMLQVRESNGLWGAVEQVEFTTEFATPPAPILTNIEFNNEFAYVSFEINNPAHEAPDIEAIYNRIYRKIDDGNWELILDDIPLDTVVMDYLAGINNLNQYYVEAVSAEPSVERSDIIEITTNLNKYILNFGDSYDVLIRLFKDTTLTENTAVEQVLKHCEGREYPFAISGIAESVEIEFSTLLDTEQKEQLQRAIVNGENFFYRDNQGRHFTCCISNVVFRRQNEQEYIFNCSVVKIELDGIEAENGT